jgi:putative transcriptional regulator
LRAERGWSQGELAERLNVSRQTVNALEVGKYDPSLQLAFRISELFERSVHDIFLKDRDVPIQVNEKVNASTPTSPHSRRSAKPATP